MRSEGSTVSGTTGHRGLSLPRASGAARDAGHVHEVRRRSAGLDWSQLYPACKVCGVRSGEVSSESVLCPGCDPARPTKQTPVHVDATPTRPAKVRRPKVARKGPAPREFDRVLVARVTALYVDGGYSVAVVAEKVAENPRVVKLILHGAGVEIRGPKTGHRPEQAPPDMVAAYQDGASVTELAATFHRGERTIRRLLDAAGVERRDDRATRSGGRKKEWDPADIARVVELYATGLSMADVAAQVGCGPRSVETILDGAGVPRRPAAHLGGGVRRDTLGGLKARLAELDVTAAEVKAWAVRTGHLPSGGPGLPPARVLDAYAAAHPEHVRRGGAA